MVGLDGYYTYFINSTNHVTITGLRTTSATQWGESPEESSRAVGRRSHTEQCGATVPHRARGAAQSRRARGATVPKSKGATVPESRAVGRRPRE
eukprot:2877523-Prymnesium_polylepis.1